jgi:hypothetical protein
MAKEGTPCRKPIAGLRTDGFAELRMDAILAVGRMINDYWRMKNSKCFPAVAS